MSHPQLHPIQGKLLPNPSTFPLHRSKQKRNMPNFKNLRLIGMSTKKSNNIPNINIAAQLDHLCNDTLQHNIANTVANFFTLNQADILQTHEFIVANHSDHAVNCLIFNNIYKNGHESIKDCLVCLKAPAIDWNLLVQQSS